MSKEEIVIPLSRSKIVFLVLGSIAFVALSLWIWTIPEGEGPFSSGFRKIASVAGILFASICGFYGCVKIFDRNPGLLIDDDGIVDNSSAVAAGRIHWHEVIGIRENEIFGQRFLTIEVDDPERFLNRGGTLKAKLNSANADLTGSPINISANSLDIDFDELMAILFQALVSYHGAEKGAAPNP